MGWSKTLAGEIAADGITANVIVPWRISTNEFASITGATLRVDGGYIANI
jgi:3-oxoacyl-[acyl-carrier protein] reductase